jgi:hypothetical protein
MRKIFAFACLLFCFSVNAQNVMLGKYNYPSEPSIAIDPMHPNVLIAASNNNNYYISQDTGKTWKWDTLTSTHGVWGDPVVLFDNKGAAYFFHLSNPPSGNWIDRIVCQKTTDKGKTWNDGSYTGLNGAKAQDKEWCVLNRKNNHIYMTWTQFDKYGSTAPNDSSLILFSKSADAGETWSTPLRINKVAGDCIDDDNTVEGAYPALGPNGELFVCWAGPNGLVLNRSYDDGKTWLPEEIKVDPMPGGWNYTIPGLMRANGLPVLLCDTTHGPNRGTLYLNWSDQRNGVQNTDIWFSKSTDSGTTWSVPVRVNDDTENKHQFLTWMTMDPVTGYLYFVFYDRRNYINLSTDVFVAVSKDGGKTFINRKISATPFKPSSFLFFGDYTNITAYNGIIRPVWARMDAGELSVWTDMTSLSDIVTEVPEVRISQGDEIEAINYPNPTRQTSYVSFKLHGPSSVSLHVYSLQGQLLQTVLDNETLGYGKHVQPIDFSTMHVKSGSYFIRLSINGKTKTLKMVVIE